MGMGLRAGRRHKGRRRVSPTPYLFLLPALVLFLVFRAYRSSMVCAEFHQRASRPDPLHVCGLSNYEKLLSDDRFLLSLVNTAYYTAASTLPILALPLLLAVVLNREVPLKALLRGAFFFPFTLSVVTVGSRGSGSWTRSSGPSIIISSGSGCPWARYWPSPDRPCGALS